MTVIWSYPMAVEENVHTRVKLPSIVHVKDRQPPAVVITDDSETTTPFRPTQQVHGRSPLSSLVLSATAAQIAGQAEGIGESKPNGVCPGRNDQDDYESSFFQASTIAAEGPVADVAPTTPRAEGSRSFPGGQTGDAMLEGESQPYVPVTSRSCCTQHKRRLSWGIFLTTFIATSWVGATHLLKAMYVDYAQAIAANALLNGTGLVAPSTAHPLYNAPFFTTWFCTTFNFLFFPMYLLSRACAPTSEKMSIKKELTESVQPYNEKGLTVIQLLGRCGMFTFLWVITNYMFVQSLRLLDATDVLALYTTNVSFIYLLSWVILQAQFVGIRIVAVITCNTGIALLAYMDGVSRSATLGGVVLATSAAGGTAVYKVLFKKFIGEVNFGQMSFFFTLVGFCNVILFWPFFLTLYFTNVEIMQWNHLPWLPLAGAALFIFLANIFGNFGIMWTYEIFLTLGLMFAIPASAVADVYMYSVAFHGMKLAGIILTMLGFMLVLLPENWPDYVTVLLRWRRNNCNKDTLVTNTSQDHRTSYRSRLRTHSGRVK